MWEIWIYYYLIISVCSLSRYKIIQHKELYSGYSLKMGKSIFAFHGSLRVHLAKRISFRLKTVLCYVTEWETINQHRVVLHFPTYEYMFFALSTMFAWCEPRDYSIFVDFIFPRDNTGCYIYLLCLQYVYISL